MKNSINPFDDLYATHEINKHFGIDTITQKRAELEVVYWCQMVSIMHRLTEPDYPVPQKVIDAYAIAAKLTYHDLQFHLNTTHHEIKALEYVLREKFRTADIPFDYLIHFGITSQDIVDPVYTLAIRDTVKLELFPLLLEAVDQMDRICHYRLKDGDGKDKSQFVARTHGQLAVPTTMVEQLSVFGYRLELATTEMMKSADALKVKFGGAVGDLAVHKIIHKTTNWRNEFLIMFKEKYKIDTHEFTTQVNGNDDKSRVFASLISVNNIIIDFCQDIWQYFSIGLFTIKRPEGHVGSSTMAQKNNPIEFENIEGILQLANNELHFMMDKLTKSRMQRDLSDSVVQRFYGLMFAKCMHAYRKLGFAVGKLEFNYKYAQDELNENYQINAELVQLLIKLKTGKNEYEKVRKIFGTGEKMSKMQFNATILLEFPEIAGALGLKEEHEPLGEDDRPASFRSSITSV